MEDEGVQLASSGISCCKNVKLETNVTKLKDHDVYLDVFLFEDGASLAKLDQVTVSDSGYQQRVRTHLWTQKQS